MDIRQLCSSLQQFIHLAELAIKSTLYRIRRPRCLVCQDQSLDLIILGSKGPTLELWPLLSGGLILVGRGAMVGRLMGWSWSYKECADSATVEANIARDDRGT